MGPSAPFSSIFVKKTPKVSIEFICNETLLQKLSLFNIMKHGESGVEWQISIQGIHLSAYWNYVWKREGSFLI